MRSSTVLPCGLALAMLASPSARACDPVTTECLPAAVAYPAYTPEGIRVGTVAAPVRLPYALEASRFTGQPRTVVFNDPGSLPGSVDPEFRLVPLPHVPHFHTQAAFPQGY